MNLSKLLGLQAKTPSRAPQWFCADISNGVPEEQIKKKIHQELVKEIEHFNYNREVWTDEFTHKVAGLYYSMFDQLYLESA